MNNSISKEYQRDIILYRELFLSSSKSLEEYFMSLKKNFFCKKCKHCCKILYKEESPSSLITDKQNDFCNLFIPFGSDKFEDVDIDINHIEARKIDSDFVDMVLTSSSKEIYFFRCKNFQNGKCCQNKKSAVGCIEYPSSSISILGKECSFLEWQKLILEKIEKEISKDILVKLKEINTYKNEFSCNHTGTCCRLACSEDSFDKLKLKAQNEDRFAQEFTSIFIPYESTEEARDIYPEFVEMMEKKLKKVYFYHCPHITDDNMCSIYEKRPQLCRDFPDNPLAILPESCGYCQWKKEVEYAALLMHALIEICGFYKDKLKYINS